jgi:hypothetical protein
MTQVLYSDILSLRHHHVRVPELPGTAGFRFAPLHAMAQTADHEFRQQICNEYEFDTGLNAQGDDKHSDVRLSPAVRQFLTDQGEVRVAHDFMLHMSNLQGA